MGWKEVLLRLLALLAGALALFGGFAALLVLRYLPAANLFYWFFPVAVLLPGTWFLYLVWGRRTTVVVALAMAVAAYFAAARVWPPGGGAPAPAASPAASAAPLVPVSLEVPGPWRSGVFATPRTLNAPAGLRVSVFAAGLGSPRLLALGPQGDLYVSVPSDGAVYVLPDRDRDGVADRLAVFAAKLDRPHGIAFRGRDLYIAESGRLLLARDEDGDLEADSVRVVSDDLPAGEGHWTRTVALGPDDRLYVSAGSSCNVCDEEDGRRAAVLRFDPAGGKGTLFARGLRNSVGLAFHPQTGELWGSDNGRDQLGDDLPPDEINRIVDGGDYGWPACYGARVPDPESGTAERCRDTLPAAVELQAHSAPLGIAFGAGLALPAPYPELLYVAFHGSWNRTVPTGYKLVGIPFRDGRPDGGPTDLLTGWLEGTTAWGRPVAPAVGADGALYLSDDRAGAVYRITWAGAEAPAQPKTME
jgi:glucose/arabinose dehydrogenase